MEKETIDLKPNLEPMIDVQEDSIVINQPVQLITYTRDQLQSMIDTGTAEAQRLSDALEGTKNNVIYYQGLLDQLN